MTSHLNGFLSDVGRHLHLGENEESQILHELKTHIEDTTQDLINSGVSSDEAVEHALDSLGGTDYIGRQLYEVHSRGSWYHTALATLPHILLALMFVFHLWATPFWVVSLLVVAMIITVFGWRKGRPRWTYPWLGYCLVTPIVSWALAMSAVGYGAWGIVTQGTLPLDTPIYIASFVYIAFSLWIVIKIVSKASRPDWIMASLAVLPVPFLAFWFFYFYNGGELFLPETQPLHVVDNSAAIVFLIVAAATAIFFRIGRRLVRVALLAITAPSMIILSWISYQGGSDVLAVFIFSVFSLAVLMSPALFDLKESRSSGHFELPEDNTEGVIT